MMRRFLLGLILALSATVASAQDINNPPVYPIATAKGGTGAALTPVVGDLIYADSTSSFARRAAVAVGQVLASAGTGTAPAYTASPSLTNVTASTQFLAPNGSCGTPAWSFTNFTTTGIIVTDANNAQFCFSGATRIYLTSAAVSMGNASAASILNSVSTITVPTLIPNRADATTGIGGASGHVSAIASSTTVFDATSTVFDLKLVPKFSGTNTTGAGSAALGSNSPAVTNSAPYTWLQVTTADGSTGYIPVWK